MATTAKKKAARRARKVPAAELKALNELQALTIPQLAALVGRHKATIWASVHADDTGLRGTIQLPGLPPIPCHRSEANGHWIVYRAQWDKAVSA